MAVQIEILGCSKGWSRTLILAGCDPSFAPLSSINGAFKVVMAQGINCPVLGLLPAVRVLRLRFQVECLAVLATSTSPPKKT